MSDQFQEGYDPRRYTGGKSDEVLLCITTTELARLFKCSKRTIRRWIQLKKLDPSNIRDIADKYQNPHKLDLRRKDKGNVSDL